MTAFNKIFDWIPSSLSKNIIYSIGVSTCHNPDSRRELHYGVLLASYVHFERTVPHEGLYGCDRNLLTVIQNLYPDRFAQISIPYKLNPPIISAPYQAEQTAT